MRTFSTFSMACGVAFLVLGGCDSSADDAAGGGDPAGGGGGGGGVTSTGGAGPTGEGGGGDGGSGDGGAGEGGGASGPTRRGTLGIGRGVLAGQTQEAWSWGYVFGSFLAGPEAAPPTCEVTTIGSCTVTDCVREPADEPGEGPSPFVSAGVVTVEGLSTPAALEPTENGDYWLDLEGDRTNADEPFTAGAPLKFRVEGDVVPGFEVELAAPARLTLTSPVLDDDLVVPRDEELQLTWDHGPGAGLVALTLEVQEPAATGDGVHVVTARCAADVVDGSLAMPAEVLGALPATESAFLLVVAGEETEVAAGDWLVHAWVTDFTMLYESVEIR